MDLSVDSTVGLAPDLSGRMEGLSIVGSLDALLEEDLMPDLIGGIETEMNKQVSTI